MKEFLLTECDDVEKKFDARGCYKQKEVKSLNYKQLFRQMTLTIRDENQCW